MSFWIQVDFIHTIHGYFPGIGLITLNIYIYIISGFGK